MARHLHQQAGGDPSQGPVREMANPTPSPEVGQDFPDAPSSNRESVGGDLSEQQLADMAERMGLGGDASESGRASSPGQTSTRPWWVGGLAGAAAAGAAIVILRRRRS